MTPFIAVSSLKVSFDGVSVLSKVSLSVKEGEVVSIVGPYGAGKTTLLKAIAGLLDEYQGEIRIDNELPAQLRKRARIGYCFQKPVLLPWLNVEENLLLPSKLRRVQPSISPAKLVGLVKAKKILKSPVGSLSGGTQQLVSILRSLSLNPEVLLLDEPFASIDEMNREILQKHLLDIHTKTKKTTLLITHSISEAVYLSDRVVVFSKKPASIKKEIVIKIDRTDPKVRTTKKFIKYTEEIKEALNA